MCHCGVRGIVLGEKLALNCFYNDVTDSKNFGNSVLLEFYKVRKAEIAQQSLEYET